MNVSRTGVLGGTFDPVHNGHLDAARAAQSMLGLEQVMLVPSRIPPHKTEVTPAAGHHRLAMANLAIADDVGWSVSDIELTSRDGDPSYTSVTLARMAEAGYDPQQLYFIIGSEAFADIAQWHDYPALLDRCHFAVVDRPGTPVADLRHTLPTLAPRMRDTRPKAVPTDAAAAQPTIWLIEAETRDISSSDIRARLARHEVVSDVVPASVAAYIADHRLYAPTGKSFA